MERKVENWKDGNFNAVKEISEITGVTILLLIYLY